MRPPGFLANWSAAIVTALRCRLELAALDLEDELLRLARLLAMALLLAMLLALALAAFAAAVVVALWDSARLAALLGVAGVFALGALVAWRSLQLALVRRGPFLAGTLEELRRDAEALRASR